MRIFETYPPSAFVIALALGAAVFDGTGKCLLVAIGIVAAHLGYMLDRHT